MSKYIPGTYWHDKDDDVWVVTTDNADDPILVLQYSHEYPEEVERLYGPLVQVYPSWSRTPWL